MKKLAVLIDADNASYKSIEAIMEEVAKYGIASVKRVYGDWSSVILSSIGVKYYYRMQSHLFSNLLILRAKMRRIWA